MWTKATRRQYRRDELTYASDLKELERLKPGGYCRDRIGGFRSAGHLR